MASQLLDENLQDIIDFATKFEQLLEIVEDFLECLLAVLTFNGLLERD